MRATVEQLEMRWLWSNTITAYLSPGGATVIFSPGAKAGEINMDYHSASTNSHIAYSGMIAISVVGGNGPDDITNNTGLPMTAWGNGGNDRISGGSNADQLHGGAGNDTINGNGGDDQIFGDDGDDALTGGSGRDLIHGGNGSDTMWASDGQSDTLVGDAGNDWGYWDRFDTVIRE